MRRGLNPDLGLAILRVVVGVIFVAHGAPKLFGGVEGTAQFFGSLGIPVPGVAAWVVAILEFFGGILMIVGFLVAPLAILYCIHLLLGIVLVHAPEGFYVIGGPNTEGIEFSLILLAANLTLLFAGPGLASVDRMRGREASLAEPVGTPGAGTASPPGERPSGRGHAPPPESAP